MAADVSNGSPTSEMEPPASIRSIVQVVSAPRHAQMCPTSEECPALPLSRPSLQKARGPGARLRTLFFLLPSSLLMAHRRLPNRPLRSKAPPDRDCQI